MQSSGRWTLRQIVIVGNLVLAFLALLAVAALALGHHAVVSGTATIEQVTVPEVLDASRVARNLEHLRRLGDTALLTDSPIERARATMSMSVIVTNPVMQTRQTVQERAQEAERILGEELGKLAREPSDPEVRKRALERWAIAATDLTGLADELVHVSSKQASDEANRIHNASSQTLRWLTLAFAALLLYGLIFGTFLIRHIARPLQRISRRLDLIEEKSGALADLPPSPVREVERLGAATHDLAAAMDAAERARLELERLATTDELSGLFNRRHFYQMAGIEWRRAQRYQRPLAVLMLDVDHFKAINDQYGHAAGDQVIVDLAVLIKRVVRDSDLVARIGEEEFAVLLPEAESDAAKTLAERLCNEARELGEGAEAAHKIRFTVSIDVAIINEASTTFETLMQCADKALYAAKHQGRDKVVLADA